MTSQVITIIWRHRGFDLQWYGSDGANHFGSGCMKGYEIDENMRLADLPMTVWHAALTEAMHWAYEPTQTPPNGWRVAQAHELELCEPMDRLED